MGGQRREMQQSPKLDLSNPSNQGIFYYYLFATRHSVWLHVKNIFFDVQINSGQQNGDLFHCNSVWAHSSE